MKRPRPRPAAKRRAQRRQPSQATRWMCITVALACSGIVLAASGPDVLSGRAHRCQPLARVPYAAPVFLGYACRDRECSAHKAGFAWAERNGVTTAAECSASPNPAFVEGCRTFAEEAVTPEQAGFEWARENELDDACNCRGGGTGFEAGCAAYVAEGGR